MAVHMEAILPASPRRVYDVLTTSAAFEAATGARATIGTAAGETFRLFDGNVDGRHVELVPDERIVQAWRGPLLPPGVYTLVRIDLTAEGNGTKMTVVQRAVPDGPSPMFPSWHEHFTTGWTKFYFEPLQRYLSS